VTPSHKDEVTATVYLEASPRHCLHYLGALTPSRGLLPRTKCRCHSTPSRRVTRRVHKVLAAARLSLKLVLSRTKPKQALSTLTSVLKPILCTMKLYGGWR